MGDRNRDQGGTPQHREDYGLHGHERREYRGKESYEQQTRGGEGGRSGMFDQRHVAPDLDEPFRNNADEDRRGYQNIGQSAEFESAPRPDYEGVDDRDRTSPTLNQPNSQEDSMLATNLLEKQHRTVEGIFSKLEHEGSDKETLVTELANDLAAHMTIEQEIFYPAIQTIDRKHVFESYEEHALAEVALKRLLAADPESDEFKARVKAAKELIQHHVKEEEEELFPKVEKALDEDKLKELGSQMQQMFERVQKAGYESAVPRGFAKTSSDVSKKVLKKSPGGRKKAA
jgi:hypothetical protein